MFVQPLIALSLAALSLARALPIEKRTGKAHWWSGLEEYETYHDRYMELDCENKHKSTFFDQCCHPRLKGADISQIPEQCLGSNDVCNDDNDDNNDQPSSTAPVNVAPVPTVPVFSASPVAPPPTHKPKASPTPTPTHTHTIPKSSPTSNPGGGSSGNTLTGSGKGTFFYQNGVAGACGNKNEDSSKVVALDSQLYGFTGGVSKYCGLNIRITNKQNGKSVIAKVADACPTCVSKGSVDMSVGAFTAIATESEGEVDIEWELFL